MRKSAGLNTRSCRQKKVSVPACSHALSRQCCKGSWKCLGNRHPVRLYKEAFKNASALGRAHTVHCRHSTHLVQSLLCEILLHDENAQACEEA